MELCVAIQRQDGKTRAPPEGRRQETDVRPDERPAPINVAIAPSLGDGRGPSVIVTAIRYIFRNGPGAYRPPVPAAERTSADVDGHGTGHARCRCRKQSYQNGRRTCDRMLRSLDVDTWVRSRRSNLDEAKTAAAGIIELVRDGGDAALLRMARKYEPGVESIRVSRDEIAAAYEQVDERLVECVVEAEARITAFHERQRARDLWLEEAEPGIILGVKTTPIDRAGLYVPGRRAAYPSTALMNAIPARVAGVPSLCACSPPPILPLTLVALDIAGVDEVYRIGGAQAIAAMALGTESIRPCRKIVGPGNAYVTAAKILLRDRAEIDFPAGPSEIGTIADGSADPAFIASDILAQAEHDPDAACILVTTDASLVGKVEAEVERQLAGAPRSEIMIRALENSGYLTVTSLDEAVDAMDRVAPEHLSIMVEDPLPVVMAVRNAGSVFVGPYAPVAAGDYASGTNHVLPTAGYAATYSGLNVAHFCKTSTVQIINREGLEAIGDVVETLAEAEGLYAHAASVRARRGPPGL